MIHSSMQLNNRAFASLHRPGDSVLLRQLDASHFHMDMLQQKLSLITAHLEEHGEVRNICPMIGLEGVGQLVRQRAECEA